MIDLDRLTSTYPRAARPALTSVSLHIDPGQTVLLTGRSGSGKSTLLGTINGLVPHYYGGRVSGRATIERLDLGPLVHRPLEQLSGGEQQRVAVAAALVREPRVLVLDEPTSQLDADGARSIFDWLRDLWRENRLTTVISEHRLGRALPGADRVIALGPEGRLEAWGAPGDVLPQLAHGPPLIQAARRLGLPTGLSGESRERLRS